MIYTNILIVTNLISSLSCLHNRVFVIVFIHELICFFENFLQLSLIKLGK